MSLHTNIPPGLPPLTLNWAGEVQGRQLRTEASAFAKIPERVAVVAWRFRWQLAPLVGGAGVFACGLSAHGAAAVPLLAAAGGVEAWRRYDWQPGGRKWLSVRERGIAVTWLAAAGLWSLGAPFAPVGAELSGAALAAGLTVPSYRWAESRLPKRVTLSPAAKAWLDMWDRQHAVFGPDPVRASKADRRDRKSVVRERVSSPV